MQSCKPLFAVLFLRPIERVQASLVHIKTCPNLARRAPVSTLPLDQRRFAVPFENLAISATESRNGFFILHEAFCKRPLSSRDRLPVQEFDLQRTVANGRSIHAQAL